MRSRPISLKNYNLGKWEYKELQAICLQYRQLKEIASCTQAEKMRELATRKINAIETAASETAEGRWFEALITVCCDGVQIGKASLAEQAGTFSKARQEFYFRLWMQLYGII